LFVNFKEITWWVLDRGTIVVIEAFMRGRFTVASVAGEDSKAREKEEVCIDWEETPACGVRAGTPICCGKKRQSGKSSFGEGKRILMCEGSDTKLRRTRGLTN